MTTAQQSQGNGQEPQVRAETVIAVLKARLHQATEQNVILEAIIADQRAELDIYRAEQASRQQPPPADDSESTR